MGYETIPPIEEIYNWYCLAGKPNRDAVRKMEEGNLPASKQLIESLLPYFNKKVDNKFEYLPKEDDKQVTTMVITSDWHIPYHDEEVLKVFFKFLQEYQPDELVLNGNINDCMSFSTHPIMRDIALKFKQGREERKRWFAIAELLRDILPNTKITYIGSQCHEGWIDKWVAASPILIEDENYTIKNWFKLDEFGIDFEKEVYDPIGNKELLITHGTIARSKCGASAMASMDMEGTSVCVGHTHKLSQVFKTNSVNEIVGIESGCMCSRTPWYTLKGRRLMMDWQQGFVLCNIKGNSFSTQCVPIIRDSNDKPYFWVGKNIYK